MKNKLRIIALIFLIALLFSFPTISDDSMDQRVLNILMERMDRENAEKILNDLRLGHYLSIEELLKPPLEHEKTFAPSGPVSPIAEFEPSEAVLIRYPFGITYDLIREMAEEIIVITLVRNTNEMNTVISLYESNNINLSNCEFKISDTDSYWTRDYGPWFIRDGNNISIIDFTYNRPRPNDNQIPLKMSQYLNTPYYNMGIYHCGGNYMADGHHIAASTDLVYYENNNYTHDQIDAIMNEYLGIETYHVVPDPNNTYIDHIDCWGKYLAPDKILIRRVDPGHPQYNAIEETAEYFSQQISAYGTRYRIYRVDTPGNQPYTNSLILNNRVFVPIMGQSHYDNLAIQAYEEAMPGYEIIGVHGSWVSTDALHCRTKEISDTNMLYIEHIPLLPYQLFNFSYEINAGIIPYSGEDLLQDELMLYYKVDNESNFTPVPLENMGDDTYRGIISSDFGTKKISYYIKAGDASGRTEYNPYIGSADPHILYPVYYDIITPYYPENEQSNISIDLDYLSWHYDNDTFDIEGFNLFLSTDANFDPVILTDFIEYDDNISIYQYDIDSLDLLPDSEYYWKIEIITQEMDLDFLDHFIFSTFSYPAPEDLEALDNYNDRIELNWNIPGKDISVSGYNVYRSLQETSGYIKINESPINNTFYTDYDIETSIIYYYAITAIYSDSIESNFSNTASAVIEDNNAPQAPSHLNANAVSPTQIDLTWTDNSDNEDGFKIERKTGSAGTWQEIDQVGENTENYNNTGLDPDTTYYYRIRAYNQYGNSEYSNEAYAKTHAIEYETNSVYRFFNTVTGGHLYTVSEIERDNIIDNLPDWSYEGIAFEVYLDNVSNTAPAYRFFNTITGIHLYTISEYERDYIIDNLAEYNYEGISFYVYEAENNDNIPVFRFFNNIRGGHLFTISEEERDYIIDNLHDWNYEGISFFVLAFSN